MLFIQMSLIIYNNVFRNYDYFIRNNGQNNAILYDKKYKKMFSVTICNMHFNIHLHYLYIIMINIARRDKSWSGFMFGVTNTFVSAISFHSKFCAESGPEYDMWISITKIISIRQMHFIDMIYPLKRYIISNHTDC